jgi:hypothetical protein
MDPSCDIFVLWPNHHATPTQNRNPDHDADLVWVDLEWVDDMALYLERYRMGATVLQR